MNQMAGKLTRVLNGLKEQLKIDWGKCSDCEFVGDFLGLIEVFYWTEANSVRISLWP